MLKLVFPFLSNGQLPELNLAAVVKHIFGFELDKAEQLGNWARRPLRTTQQRYAAMDAFCLINLYEEVYARLGQ